MNSSQNVSGAVPGVIQKDALYSKNEIKGRMGWTEASFRAARRKGLRTHRVGKRVYVTGVDAIAFVTETGVGP